MWLQLIIFLVCNSKSFDKDGFLYCPHKCRGFYLGKKIDQIACFVERVQWSFPLYFENDQRLNLILNNPNNNIRCKFFGFDLNDYVNIFLIKPK